MTHYRIGYGEDAHKLAPGHSLMIGGVQIDSPHGAEAHSDGDVLLHALSDALLSAFALGDIGHYFPPSEPAFKNLASNVIILHVLKLLREEIGEVGIVNVSAVVTLDTPKLGPQRSLIQEQLAALLGIPQKNIGLTFKTSEGLAPLHVQARVSALLQVLQLLQQGQEQ